MQVIIVQNQWKGKNLANYYNWFIGLKPDWCDLVVFTGNEFKIYGGAPALPGKLREYEINFEVSKTDQTIVFLKDIEGRRKLRLGYIERYQYDAIDAGHRVIVQIKVNKKTKDLVMKRWWMMPNTEKWASSKVGVTLTQYSAEEGFYTIHKKVYQRIVEEEKAK